MNTNGAAKGRSADFTTGFTTEFTTDFTTDFTTETKALLRGASDERIPEYSRNRALIGYRSLIEP
jgi:hypothetical protein